MQVPTLLPSTMDAEKSQSCLANVVPGYWDHKDDVGEHCLPLFGNGAKFGDCAALSAFGDRGAISALTVVLGK